MNGALQLDLKDVSVRFNGFLAVDSLTLSVNPGELRCLIGPNGAGKTTTLDIICGKTKPSNGEIRLGDNVLNNLEEHNIARIGIGRKFQVPSVFRQLTVRENLLVGLSKVTGVVRNAFRFRRAADNEGVEKLAELVGLRDHLDQPADRLSHGQTQWLEIALLLAQDPKLILMDEPTAGMTTHETRKTAELFNRLKGNRTLIVVEHDMAFVKEIAEVISVMHQGKLLAQGTVAEMERDPAVMEAYLGSKGIGHA
jgi:urea transport system ATP-binding protein